MLFQKFASSLETLSQTTKRLEITQQLAELLAQLTEDEIQPSCYLLQGRLTPAYESLEFQLSIKMILRALSRVKQEGQKSQIGAGSRQEKESAENVSVVNLFGEEDDAPFQSDVEREYKKIGDLGEVAKSVIDASNSSAGRGEANGNVILSEMSEENAVEGSIGNPATSVLAVYHKLQTIAHESGDGSQERKLLGLIDLFEKVDGLSAKYIVRIILGRLRLGFSDMTMLDALSWAMTGAKSEHDVLEEAYQKRADIGWLATVYLQEKDATKRQHLLQKTEVVAGVPVMSALCQRLNSTEEMIAKMGQVYAEPKYDGLRVQIHFSRGNPSWTVRTFTRNLEESTNMFPELVAAADQLSCQSCILDAEAIGYDKESDEFLPFQLTITRKRKHGIGEKSLEVPLLFFVFDILSLDGKSLIELPLKERKKILTELFTNSKTEVLRQTENIETSDAVQLRQFHEQCLAEGLEGMVVKSVTGTYQSGRKGWNWVKIKEEEGTSGKLSDTMDGVVMGYYVGRGKRTKFGVGAFLIGVLSPDEQIVTLAKIGTGLTDEQFQELKSRCDVLKADTQPANYQIHKMLTPDVFLSPGLVVEVAADEVTHSPVHTAGVALRFPRLVKFRDDKKWSDATTLDELQHIKIK